MKFRTLNRLYASLFGYFWLPCPECGQEFGGHEWVTGMDSSNKDGQGICPDCTKAGKGHDFSAVQVTNAMLLKAGDVLKLEGGYGQ